MSTTKISLLKFIFLPVILFFSIVAISQQLPQPYWQRTFGGYGDDYSVGLTRTYDRGFVLVGYGYQSIDGDIDSANLSYEYYAWVVKLDSVRNIIWQRKIRRVQPMASCSTPTSERSMKLKV